MVLKHSTKCLLPSPASRASLGGKISWRRNHTMSVTYPPSSDFVSGAHVDAERYEEMYARSISDPDGFWAEQA
ncbi:acetyl-coenzyme A synthetase N-terminal domain-containing protein, partial [Salipiger thiooxidans]|uniref:acetyl-coenzyme A synthetase N-terminal domain-containing protein n=1 Tax=Salipiger thiooxidans TaxID=282683 RepID=UPI0038503D9B